MTEWVRPKACESSWCVEWLIDEYGRLHLRDSTNPEHILVLTRNDGHMLVDAARRGEVYPYGQ